MYIQGVDMCVSMSAITYASYEIYLAIAELLIAIRPAGPLKPADDERFVTL